MSAQTSLYVAAYVPEFPAQALLRLRPEQARQPVAVMDGTAPLEEVCSANRHAFRQGVMQGMTRAELDSFDGITVLRRSAAEEHTARTALLEAAAAFTPRVEIVANGLAAFLMVMDMTGSSRMFGGSEEMLERVQMALQSLRIHVRFAASANFHAAVCFAPCARRKPCVLRPGEEKTRLHELPLASLNLSLQQAETLEMWGLRTLGDLACLPETELIVRLGQDGKRLRQMARGELPHLFMPEAAPLVLEEFLAFDAPLEILESLLFVMGPLLQQLFARAGNRALALASITVRLGMDGGGEHERHIKPALPLVDREIALKLIHLDLQAHPPSAGVLSVRVQAEPGHRSKVQQGLFAPPLPEATRLDVTLARITALVGEGRVGSPRLLDMHRPDSFAMERFTLKEKRAEEAEAVFHAALRRCRPARHVHVRQWEQKPVSFFLEDRAFSIEQAFGPWRQSGQWWSPDVWSEQEWDVRASSGEQVLLCVLAENLLSHEWRMVALYD